MVLALGRFGQISIGRIDGVWYQDRVGLWYKYQVRIWYGTGVENVKIRHGRDGYTLLCRIV